MIHFHGIGLDANDDKGQPPYPLVKDFDEAELEYLTSWVDHYTLDLNDSPKQFIGYLKEFHEQQDSNSTQFVLPPIP